MAHKIRVFIKEPGKKLRSVSISNTLKNLQKTVGGANRDGNGVRPFLIFESSISVSCEE